MTVLVTGASGFVGSAVLRALVREGAAVRVLVRPSSARGNLEGVACEAVEGDLRDRRSLARALAGTEALFHVAADYRLWARDPNDLFAVNVEGTRALMEAALEAGVKRIVYTSSVATLGILPDGTPADEATPVSFAAMIGPYKQSKFRAEEVVRRMAAEQGLPAVIVNPSAPIGPRDAKPTPTGKMVVDAAAGRMPAFVDTGLNVVHVEDVAAGHLAAFARGRAGERYVLGGENLMLRDILGAIAAIAGRSPPRIRLPHGAVMPVAAVMEWWARAFGGEPLVCRDAVRMARKRMFFSHAKAARELDYRPRPAREALADAVAWFRAHGYLG